MTCHFNTNRNRRKGSHQRASIGLSHRGGAAIVEFAVVMPIILLFFTTTIELSRVLMLQHTADTSAYEAARAAMVPGAKSQDARDAAQKLLRANRLTSTNIMVSPDVILETTPLISVHVEIPVAPNSWLPPFWFSRSTVSSDVTLFCERPPMVQLTGIPNIKIKKQNVTNKNANL